MGNLVSSFTDALNISMQAGQIVQGIQTKLSAGSIFDLLPILASAVPQGLQLAATLTYNVAAMSAQVPIATAQIPICATTAAATAVAKLNAIPTNVQSCIQRG
jgi:hypothetical protein